MVLQKVAAEVFMYFLIKACNIPTLILKKLVGTYQKKKSGCTFLDGRGYN